MGCGAGVSSSGTTTTIVTPKGEVTVPFDEKDATFGASCTSVYTTEQKRLSYDSLTQVLAERLADAELRSLVSALLGACARVAEALRTALVTVEGTSNTFGDTQLTVDVIADKLLFEFAEECGLVFEAASEEQPTLRTFHAGGRFVLCWDPLDGSSIVDNNWSVGTFVGVWDRRTGLIGARGQDQLTSLIVQYGPRVTALAALEDGAYEFTLVGADEWICSRERIAIEPKAKIFSPANLRAAQDLPGYASLVDHWMKERYTLRYAGGLVPDIYQQFTKRQGVFANPTSPKAPAKLRLAFEAAPVALLVERAGGRSSDGVTGCSVLDVVINSVDQRTALCVGSALEVERFNATVLGVVVVAPAAAAAVGGGAGETVEE